MRRIILLILLGLTLASCQTSAGDSRVDQYYSQARLGRGGGDGHGDNGR